MKTLKRIGLGLIPISLFTGLTILAINFETAALWVLIGLAIVIVAYIIGWIIEYE